MKLSSAGLVGLMQDYYNRLRLVTPTLLTRNEIVSVPPCTENSNVPAQTFADLNRGTGTEEEVSHQAQVRWRHPIFVKCFTVNLSLFHWRHPQIFKFFRSDTLNFYWRYTQFSILSLASPQMFQNLKVLKKVQRTRIGGEKKKTRLRP